MHRGAACRLRSVIAGTLPAALLLLASMPALARPADLHPTNPGAVVVALSAMPDGTDPLTTDDQYSADIEALLYDPLYYVTPTLSYAPDLARSWRVSPDGRVYTYALDPKARWSTGAPVTAQDVVYSLEAYAGGHDTGALRGMFGALATVTAVSAHEVRVRLRRPDPAWPGLLADLAILPRPASRQAAKTAGHKGQAGGPTVDVTDGPYMVRRWDAQAGSIVLAANPTYFRGAPHIARVEVRVVASPSAALAGLRHGSIQVAVLPPSLLRQASRVATLRVHLLDTLAVTLIAFNVRTPPLRQGSVRRALALAVNRSALIAGTGMTAAALPVGPWPAVMPAAPAAPMPFAPTQARALLDSAGWRRGRDGVRERDGKRLRLTLRYAEGSRALARAAARIAADWRSVGASVRLMPTSFAALRQAAQSGRYQAMLAGVTFGAGASAGALVAGRAAWPPGGDDIARYDDPMAMALVRAMDADSTAAVPQAAALAALASVLSGGPPYVPLWTAQSVVVTTATLSGFVANPAGPDLYQPQTWTLP